MVPLFLCSGCFPSVLRGTQGLKVAHCSPVEAGRWRWASGGERCRAASAQAWPASLHVNAPGSLRRSAAAFYLLSSTCCFMNWFLSSQPINIRVPAARKHASHRKRNPQKWFFQWNLFSKPFHDAAKLRSHPAPSQTRERKGQALILLWLAISGPDQAGRQQ